jgi:hypothetical protein
MQFLIGDVSFSLDTNIGLYFDKIGKTMLQQMFLRKKSFLENNTTICELISSCSTSGTCHVNLSLVPSRGVATPK